MSRWPSLLAFSAALFTVSGATPSPAAFDAAFTARTMRVDYFHTGGLGRETVALDRVVCDGPWAGSRTRLIDDLNLGSHLFEVVDPATHRALPEPWDKDGYEAKAKIYLERRQAMIRRKASEAEMDALFREQRAVDAPMLASMKYSGKTGAFEGAAYKAKGSYRPQTDCIMFTRDDVGFCRVCSRAIERVIDQYARP